MEQTFEETWFHVPLKEVGNSALFSEGEAHHLLKVLRIRPGMPIVATNGEGSVFRCKTSLEGTDLYVEAMELLVHEPEPPRLHLVLSILKGRDSEDPAESLCQLPIAAIHLVTTDYTQDFKGQDHDKLVDRLRQKSKVAVKQAKKTWMTRIHSPLALRKWRSLQPGRILVAHPGADMIPKMDAGPIYLLIGPEGGFSREELQWLFDQEGVGRLSLGNTRLRASVAPTIAVGKLMGLGLLPGQKSSLL